MRYKPEIVTGFEKGLLSGILVSEGQTMETVGYIVQPEDFYNSRYQKIYGEIYKLWQEKQPIDIVTVLYRLEGVGEKHNASRDELVEIEEFIPATHSATEYAKMVKSHAAKRKIMAEGHKLAKEYEPENISRIMEELEHQVSIMSVEPELEFKHISDVLIETIRRIERKETLFTAQTGFIDLDNLICGFEPGRFYLLAGRPSMGKSAMAFNILRKVAKEQGKKVAVFTLEVTENDVAMHLLTQERLIPFWKLQLNKLSASDWQTVTSLAEKLSSLSIRLSSVTEISKMKQFCKQMQKAEGLDLVIIDYIGLIKPNESKSRQEQVADISRNLKHLARELNIPVLAVSQLNRAVEARENKRPLMSDLRDSGTLEQDADVVLLVYREAYYDRNTKDGKTEIIVGKNRTGPQGIAELVFFPEWLRFENAEVVK